MSTTSPANTSPGDSSPTTSSPSSAPSWRYRPELDGLRAIAVYLVLLFHSGSTWFGGGFTGVDVFFVLSGFLVSNVLLAEIDRTGGLSLRNFYARRIRRLLPAAVLVIVLTAALQLLVSGPEERHSMIRQAQAALLYFSNWQFIAESQDYFATDVTHSPFLHFWSLSIEEQFYLAFPLAMVVCVKRRVSRRWMIAIFSALGAASLLAQVLAADNVTFAYYATHTRLYQLLAGVVLALVLHPASRAQAHPSHRPNHPNRPSHRLTPRAGTLLALLGLLGLALVGTAATDGLSASTRGMVATAAATVTVLGLFVAPTGVAARLLARRTPVYLGTISYGIYLWHWPVILFLQRVFDVRPWVIAIFATLIATGLAALSFQLWENPIRRAKRLGPWPIGVIAVGLAASVLAAAVVVPQVLDNPRRSRLVAALPADLMMAKALPWLAQPVPRQLDLVKAAENPPEVPKCTTDDPQGCLLVEGTGERWLIVGDSQAQMFVAAFTQLAKEHDLTLYAAILAGCPWQSGLRRVGPTVYGDVCQDIRAGFYPRRLAELDIDRIVVITLARHQKVWQTMLSDSAEPSTKSLQQLQSDAGAATLDLMHQAGAEVTLTHSLVGTAGYRRGGPNPLRCLERASTLGECAVLVPRKRPFVDDFYQQWARDKPGVNVVDLTPVYCPDTPICRPVLKGEIVWRDSDHITPELFSARREALWKALNPQRVP